MTTEVSDFLSRCPMSEAWQALLKEEFEKPYFEALCRRVDEARREKTVYPPEEDVFAALNLVAPEEVRCVIFGQDPYHGPNQAQGLAFSVRSGVAVPRSLKNISKELQADLGVQSSGGGDLTPWCRQGVLLLNTVLTVEDGNANSHAKYGWQEFTDAVCACLGRLPHPVAFVLWGGQAQKKQDELEAACTGAPRLYHFSAHPSPLSASRGFFGSHPFSTVNNFLKEHGVPEIDWYF